MSYQDAVAHLDALGIDAMKHATPTLDRIRALTDALDRPQSSVPMIHITGTNGKTSVARIASALLDALDLSVGTYTSPHLQKITERLTLNGAPIPDEAFGDLFAHIRPYLELVERDGEKLTYFELLTAMFYLWTADTPVDVSVVEVGLGGRWDATNVADAPVAVVTNVGLDHTEFMGAKRAGIADEKSGIIKPAAVAVTGERDPEIIDVIRQHADQNEAALLVLDRDFEVVENKIAVGGRYLTVRTSAGEYPDLYVPLHGAHQATNAALALQAVLALLPTHEIAPEIVNEGLSKVVVPGRLESLRVENSDAPVILDVAHNPDGMSASTTALIETFAFDKVWFVFGALRGKDHEGMLREIDRVPNRVLLTKPESDRALPVEELAETATALDIEHETFDTVQAAVDAAVGSAGSSDLICITGSHYVIGEARTYLHG